jgi:phosphatidylglycerol---prolipoprotein diacylglyceryl transferase
MSKLTRIYLAAVGGIVLLGGLALFLGVVFSGTYVLSQGLRIGPLSVRYYGLALAVAILAAYFLARWRAKAYGLDVARADSILFSVAIAGFIGARLYHVASDWSYYAQHMSQIVAVWRGGLSIFGAFIGGFLMLIWQARQKPVLPLLKLADWLAPSVIVGQILGRFGNLFNYEAYGYPTSLPWKMNVPIQFRAPDYITDQFFHPLFLYEALGNGLIFLILWLLRRQLTSGRLFFAWLLLYNLMRFFIEFLRIDSTFLGSVRLNSITSGVLALAGLVGLIILHVRKSSQNN